MGEFLVRILDVDLKPLAGESLGTRSMAVAIQGQSTQILCDPGVDLAPNRFNLPPHSLERKRRSEHRQNILAVMQELPVVGFWISHYHFDHFPKINEAVQVERNLHHFEPDLRQFSRAPFLLKHPTTDINQNQRRRARKFTRALNTLDIPFRANENLSVQMAEFQITGSPPLPHGHHSPMGHVVACSLIHKDTKLCFTGDVMGIPLEIHVTWLINEQPDILILDGPMKPQLDQFKINIKQVADQTELKYLVIEHHLLRSGNWQDLIADELDYLTEAGVQVACYAELLKTKIELLEVSRKQLYDFLPESNVTPVPSRFKK